MTTNWIALGALGIFATLTAAQADVTVLASVPGATKSANEKIYLEFDNPLTGSAGNPAAYTSGSLFVSATLDRPGNVNWSSLSVRPNASDSTNQGSVAFGRNNDVAGFSIFNNLDNPGAGSGSVRTGANPAVRMVQGTFTIVGEIQFDTPDSGTLRAWIANDAAELDLANPSIVTTFSNGFLGSTETLHLRYGSGGNGEMFWSDVLVQWAGSDADRLSAFNNAVAVPEPSQIALLTAAVLAGVALVRRRKQASR